MASPTSADLANKMSDLIDRWRTFINQHRDWLGGTTTGGPFLDGRYPLTDARGNTTHVESPAKQSAMVSANVNSASAHATSAGTARTGAETARDAAKLSETNSANSATSSAAARDLAKTYADTSGTHAANARTDATSAATSASNASNSATAAANSATDANSGKAAVDAAKTASEAARDKARLWSDQAVDTPVEGTVLGNNAVYSAKHHAAKAATFNPVNFYTKTESDTLHAGRVNKAGDTMTGLLVAPRLDVTNQNGSQTHFNWDNGNKNFIRGDTEVTNTLGVGMHSLGSGATTTLAISSGAFGQQRGHIAFHQTNAGTHVQQFVLGVDTDRTMRLWAYNDTGAYLNNPVSIARDAPTLAGVPGAWTIGGSTIITHSNYAMHRLDTSASTGVGNFNDMLHNGWWMLTGSGATNNNQPVAGSSDWFMVDVRRHNASWVQQEAYQFTATAGTTRYRRHMNNGVWGAWTYNLGFRNVYMGNWQGHGYDGLMSNDGTYIIMGGNPNDATTYISARAGAPVVIRANANDENSAFEVHNGLIRFRATNVERLAANGAAWLRQPRIIVGTSVDINQMADGDLFVQV